LVGRNRQLRCKIFLICDKVKQDAFPLLSDEVYQLYPLLLTSEDTRPLPPLASVLRKGGAGQPDPLSYYDTASNFASSVGKSIGVWSGDAAGAGGGAGKDGKSKSAKGKERKDSPSVAGSVAVGMAAGKDGKESKWENYDVDIVFLHGRFPELP
jgi:hypothetical protein